MKTILYGTLLVTFYFTGTSATAQVIRAVKGQSAVICASGEKRSIYDTSVQEKLNQKISDETIYAKTLGNERPVQIAFTRPFQVSAPTAVVIEAKHFHRSAHFSDVSNIGLEYCVTVTQN